jgi:glyoxylase-like metal-dependent hydrolase (beta-lactamase superfamily II)
MLGRWTRSLIWNPYAHACRVVPLWPFKAQVTTPTTGVTCIRIDNAVTRFLSQLAGGYDYAVCYLVDGSLLVDTGFPWARRCLKKTLCALGADKSISHVVNTHYHEDHTGNNDLLAELTNAEILAHRLAVPEIRFPPNLPWYRSFLFGPSSTVEVTALAGEVRTAHRRFEVLETPGHCPGHICLFEPNEGWLFSGDLYIAADIDSQLRDADGPLWIESLRRVLKRRPRWLFDAHGVVVEGEAEVKSLLERKLEFLETIQRRVAAAAKSAQSISELTRKVFDRRDLKHYLSQGEGWMSIITASDFSRCHVVKSFLRATD